MNDVVIAIPTFRRPHQLRQLLDTLKPQIDARTTVIVADNDCSAEARSVVETFGSLPARLVYVEVRQRGLSAVRNALVDAAFEHAPGWRWMAMLDDDGLAEPNWLEQILACAERFGAHLVGGPVIGVLPEGANRLARNSIFAARRRWPTGLVESLNTTQNLLISRRLEALIGRPFFRADYGASGGEDYDLFRRTGRAGGRIVWCDEALVHEPAPADRLTLRGVVARYYSTGIYMAKIDRSYDGNLRSWRIAVGGMVGALLRTTRDVARVDKDGSARGVLAIGHYAGRLAGLLGAGTARYAKDEKTL